VILNSFFLVTLLLDWYALGLKNSYFRHPRVSTETISNIVFMLFIYYWSKAEVEHNKFKDVDDFYNDDAKGHAEVKAHFFDLVKFLEAITIIRLLRLTIYLEEMQTFRIIVETLKSLMSPFWSVITVLFSIFYVFAVIGMAMFGGKISVYTEAIRNNDSTPFNWGLNNFNDFTASFVTLFELMVVNNWMITADMFAIISGTKWVLVYFVAFYAIAVLVGLNIIVCFAIDMYASIRRLDSEQKSHEEKLYHLALEVKRQDQGTTFITEHH
jgi:Ion transport protein